MGAARGKTAGGASTAGSGRHLGVCCCTVRLCGPRAWFTKAISLVLRRPLQNFLGDVVFHESRVRCLLALFKARPLRPGSLFACSSSSGVWVCLHATSVGLRAAKVDDVHGKARTRTQKQPAQRLSRKKQRASGHDDRRFAVWGLWVGLLRCTQFRHSSKGSVAVIFALFNFVRVRVIHTFAHRCKCARIPSKFCLDIACSCALS